MISLPTTLVAWIAAIIGAYTIARLGDLIVGPNTKGKSRTGILSAIALVFIVFALIMVFQSWSQHENRSVPLSPTDPKFGLLESKVCEEISLASRAVPLKPLYQELG